MTAVIEGLEGKGTECKLTDTTSAVEEDVAELEAVEEEDISVLNESNKSFSQKLLEVSSTDINYDASSPHKVEKVATTTL